MIDIINSCLVGFLINRGCYVVVYKIRNEMSFGGWYIKGCGFCLIYVGSVS